MFDLPPLDTLAKAAAAIGLLFLLRYALVMRRIWRARGHRPSFQFGDYFRAVRPLAFGEDMEPERRYAARQLILGGVFLAAALLFFAIVLVSGASAPMEV